MKHNIRQDETYSGTILSLYDIQKNNSLLYLLALHKTIKGTMGIDSTCVCLIKCTLMAVCSDVGPLLTVQTDNWLPAGLLQSVIGQFHPKQI